MIAFSSEDGVGKALFGQFVRIKGCMGPAHDDRGFRGTADLFDSLPGILHMRSIKRYTKDIRFLHGNPFRRRRSSRRISIIDNRHLMPFSLKYGCYQDES
jgi:hypothetical protein